MFEFDWADIKPTAVNWLIIGLCAATFFITLKYLVNRWPVPGLTEFANAL